MIEDWVEFLACSSAPKPFSTPPLALLFFHLICLLNRQTTIEKQRSISFSSEKTNTGMWFAGKNKCHMLLCNLQHKIAYELNRTINSMIFLGDCDFNQTRFWWEVPSLSWTHQYCNQKFECIVQYTSCLKIIHVQDIYTHTHTHTPNTTLDFQCQVQARKI